jgi:hypothetical protein
MEGRNWQVGMYDQSHILMPFESDVALIATKMRVNVYEFCEPSMTWNSSRRTERNL